MLLIICLVQISGTMEEPQPVAVETIMPQVTNVYDSVQMRGTVVEGGRQPVYSEGPCRVAECYVKTGDYVEQGAPLMRIVSLESQQVLPAMYRDLEKSLSDFAQGASLTDPDLLREQAAALVDMMAVSAGSFPQAAEVTETVITSPVSGIVMQAAEAGEPVSGILPCAIVSDMTRLAVRAEVGEGLIGQIEEGMPCEVRIEAFQEEPFSGIVDSIMPYARQTGGLTTPGEVKTQVNIRFDGPGDLRPGYSAVVRAKANYEANVATLPYEAIGQDEENREYVYILQGDIAVKTYIRTGREMEALVEISQGLTGEELVILNPQEIEHGQRVAIR